MTTVRVLYRNRNSTQMNKIDLAKTNKTLQNNTGYRYKCNYKDLEFVSCRDQTNRSLIRKRRLYKIQFILNVLKMTYISIKKDLPEGFGFSVNHVGICVLLNFILIFLKEGRSTNETCDLHRECSTKRPLQLFQIYPENKKKGSLWAELDLHEMLMEYRYAVQSLLYFFY